MSETSASESQTPPRDEIRVRGHLGSRWATWFDGMRLTTTSDGLTVLDGPIVDQAALHGVLTKLRDIGLPLVSLALIDPQAPPRGE